MEGLNMAYGWRPDFSTALGESASALCSHLEFDTWKFIMFNRDRLYGYVLCSAKNDSGHNAGENRILGRKSNPQLSAMIDSGETIYHRCERENDKHYNPIYQDAAAELYLPVTSTRRMESEVIACLYFAKSKHPGRDVRDLLRDGYAAKLIATVQRIGEAFYGEYIANRKLLNLIHIFIEITAKDPYMRGHPCNVARLSHALGLELGLNAYQLHRLHMAAMLQDIGKLYLPESTLNKPGPLTDFEMQEMKQHPIHSYNIVKDLVYGIHNLDGIEKYVLHHHERYDGTGYPDGLRGEDIPLKSRILAVADAVSAMGSERAHENAKSLEYIIGQLITNKGAQFDPDIAQMMVDRLVRRKDEREELLNQPIILGTIELLSEKRSCQVQGTLIKTEFAYRFKINHEECRCKECKCEISTMRQATFYTESNGKILEYDAAIIFKDKRKIYLSKLNPKLSADCFSLVWPISGIAGFKDSTTAVIKINRLGGNFLDFHINKKYFDKMRTPEHIHAVTIKFEDENIRVTGKVTKTVKTGYKLYCNFIYLNILESTRDRIFRQIFRKEVAHLAQDRPLKPKPKSYRVQKQQLRDNKKPQ